MAKVILECCESKDTTEYWHEHSGCSDEMCYAIECLSCSQWKTLCGMEG